MKYILISNYSRIVFFGLSDSRQVGAGIYGWHNVAVTEDMEIIQTPSI
jgi:hypothetical protein